MFKKYNDVKEIKYIDLWNCPNCKTSTNTYRHPFGKVWCPKCGACGIDGCCPSDMCKDLPCLYGEGYLKTYYDLEQQVKELEAENIKLREEQYVLAKEIHDEHCYTPGYAR